MDNEKTLEKRNRKVTFRLSEKEYFILKERCRLSKARSQEAFLRQLILQDFIYEVDLTTLGEFNRNLSAIGRNINQIARKVNGTGSINEIEVARVKEDMDKIWRIVKFILSKFR